MAGRHLANEISPARTVGFTTGAVFFGALVVWSWLAPIAGAVVAFGTVAPEGATRTVQHLEGGIIEAFHVKEGDVVRRNDPLLKLDDVQAVSIAERLRLRLAVMAAVEQRLVAELEGKASWTLPDALSRDRRLASLFEAEISLLELRSRRIVEEEAIADRRMAELTAASVGAARQGEAIDDHLAILDLEIAAVRKLVDQGIQSKSRLWALERERAERETERRARLTDGDRAGAQFATLKEQKDSIVTRYREEINTQLEDIRKQKLETAEQLAAADDVLRRTTLTAPVDGVVANLRLRTLGAVLEPGRPVLDLVPLDEPLVVEARIDPSDIDDVAAGLPAQVRLLSYTQRNLMPFDATVETVSADRRQDERSGKSYFLARLRVAPAAANVPMGVGMPVEVLIATRTHTLLDYLADPVLSLFRRGFKEG